MDKQILNNGENTESSNGLKQKSERNLHDRDNEIQLPVDSNALDVVESVEVAGETAEEKKYSEKSGKYIQKTYTQSADPQNIQKPTTVAAVPPIEEMIKQTVAAIENELHKTEGEMKALMKRKSISPHMINDKVIRIRFLNGLLSKMKRVAKLTEDFIVGLWKQYVKRMG